MFYELILKKKKTDSVKILIFFTLSGFVICYLNVFVAELKRELPSFTVTFAKASLVPL